CQTISRDGRSRYPSNAVPRALGAHGAWVLAENERHVAEHVYDLADRDLALAQDRDLAAGAVHDRAEHAGRDRSVVQEHGRVLLKASERALALHDLTGGRAGGRDHERPGLAEQLDRALLVGYPDLDVPLVPAD